MRSFLAACGIFVGVIAAIVLAHMAFIEIGREVVTLRTREADGAWRTTRLWVVDDGGAVWLHSAGEDWLARFEGDPTVELERAGASGRYRALLVPEAHSRVDALLREKYGVADRWVRLISPCNETTVPVRLEPIEVSGS